MKFTFNNLYVMGVLFNDSGERPLSKPYVIVMHMILNGSLAINREMFVSDYGINLNPKFLNHAYRCNNCPVVIIGDAFIKIFKKVMH